MTDAERAWREAEMRAYRARLPLLARHDLLSFVELTHPKYSAQRVHEELCKRLMAFEAAIARGESPRLIVCMPPRGGKTTISSQHFPPWAMARNPGWEVICASYAFPLAKENSRKARAIARSPEAVSAFPVLRGAATKGGRVYANKHREEVDQIDAWNIPNRSTLRAVGRGGSLTGHGAHILILDDMLKDDSEADSEATREGLWSWYQSTAYTRVSPGGGVLVITTRWHEDDLVGKLLKAQQSNPDADRWEVFNVQAIAEEDEGWRKAGESFDPVRWPIERLHKIRANLLTSSPRWWTALYEGRPVPTGGGRFKRSMWRRYSGDPRVVARAARELWLSVDCANEEGASACYSVLHVFGLFSTAEGDRLRLLDEERIQGELPELLAAYDRVLLRWPRVSKKLVEYAANGIALCQMRPGTIRVKPSGDKDYPGGSKEQRASYTLTALESGLGPELPEDQWAPWAREVIEEHASFPAGRYKDRVDTVSQVCIRVLVHSDTDDFWARVAREVAA